MPCITTCPTCGACYEESSEEEANRPGRSCMSCWREAKALDAVENELCARICANDHALNVAVARLLPIVAPMPEERDPERWDGLE